MQFRKFIKCSGHPKEEVTAGLQRAEILHLSSVPIKIGIYILLGLRKYCRVVGTSMSPTLLEDDLIIYKPRRFINENNIQPGTIVILNHPNKNKKLIIKRIYSVNRDGIDIRGDNKNSSSDSRHFGLISKKSIIGLVQIVLHNK